MNQQLKQQLQALLVLERQRLVDLLEKRQKVLARCINLETANRYIRQCDKLLTKIEACNVLLGNKYRKP